MTVAAWLPTHAYAAGALVNPITPNGHSFICTTAGTSAASEPAWSGRYPAVTDGSAAWAPYSIVTPAQVRAELNLGDEMTVAQLAASQYSDTIVGNYILAAISALEQTTRRYIVNRPGATVLLTTMNRAQVAIPALRTATTVSQYGGALTANASYYLLPDAQQTGVYTAIQFRTFRNRFGPWYYANPNWFDMNLDSPFFPANYAGYGDTSLPNDTAIVGDWGWEPTFEPLGAVHAVSVLSEFFTMRPPAILADSAITPQGGVLTYSQMPAEVRQFARDFSTGTTAVSVG